MSVKLSDELITKIIKAAPSTKIWLSYKGKRSKVFETEKKYRYYDWASLTKVVFTVSAAILLFENDELKLKKRVHDYIPWFKNKSVTIESLLNHHSGLRWWAPFYKSCSSDDCYSTSRLQKNIELQRFLQNEKVSVSQKSLYSDLDFWLLGFVLERVCQKDLSEIWNDIQTLFCLKKTHFNSLENPIYKKSDYAPTEKCPWRKQTIQGSVHDDNAWAMGGVATHAGLFGPIEELLSWMENIRSSWLFDRGIFKKKTLKKHIIKNPLGDWAGGFMTPTYGSSSAGDFFSKESFGHTGFTGTSIWFDPKVDLVVAIVSNRTFPDRKNNLYLNLRPEIHNEIYTQVMK